MSNEIIVDYVERGGRYVECIAIHVSGRRFSACYRAKDLKGLFPAYAVIKNDHPKKEVKLRRV